VEISIIVHREFPRNQPVKECLPARRYASAGISSRNVSCPSVRVSVARRYCIETAGRIGLIFCTHVSLDLRYGVFKGN